MVDCGTWCFQFYIVFSFYLFSKIFLNEVIVLKYQQCNGWRPERGKQGKRRRQGKQGKRWKRGSKILV